MAQRNEDRRGVFPSLCRTFQTGQLNFSLFGGDMYLVKVAGRVQELENPAAFPRWGACPRHINTTTELPKKKKTKE